MPETEEKIRVFVAIHPPRELVDRLAALIQDLRRTFSHASFRWVKPEQLHLTIQFPGSVSKASLNAWEEAVVEAVGRHRAFTLTVEGFGCFPTVPRARVLWAGLGGETGELQRLKVSLDTSLKRLGYQVEPRPFHPHLTLARIQSQGEVNRLELRRLMDPGHRERFGQWRIGSVELMQSVLGREGAVYYRLQSFQLG